VREELLNGMRYALVQAREFHEERDRMNATLHLDSVRWSPLTELLRDTVLRLDQERLAT